MRLTIKPKKHITGESGQSLAEFAYIVPILVLMFSFVVDFARVVDAKILVNNAAAEVVRTMSLYGDDSHTEDVLYHNYGDRLDASRLTYTVNKSPLKTDYYNYHSYSSGSWTTTPARQDYIDTTVTVKYDVDIVMPLSQLIFGGDSLEVSSKFTSRVMNK